MNSLGYKFLILVLVTFCYNLDRICAQNATKMLSIPIISTNFLGPKQFERIVVPYYPPIPRKEIPVTEKIVDIESTTQEVKTSSKMPQIPPNCNDGKRSDTKSYSYVTRSDGFSKKPLPKKYSAPSQPKPKQTPTKASEPKETKPKETKSKDLPVEHRTLPEPNEIQPLHINTKVFKKSPPDHKKPSLEEEKKKFEEQEEKLKMKNLPENPEEVPKTDWFDNHGKYNYGIIHDSQQIEETASVEDATENESKEVPKGVHAVVPNPQKIQHPQPFQPPVTVQHPQPVATVYHPPPTATNINHHPLTFKSIFSDPSSHSKVHQQNGNNGNFLYKSEIYYPNYRDHIYLPLTTYYGDANIFPKHLPVFNSHSVYHTPQAVPQHNTINQNSNKAHDLPIKVPLPIPKAPSTSTKSTPAPKIVYPVIHKAELPAQKHPLPPKKPVEKKPPTSQQPKKQQEEEEEYDEDEEIEDDGGKAEYYDYEEGDSVEDDEGSNDNIQGESSEDYEEDENEEGEEEKPTYRHSSYNNARDDEKSSEDEFDRAWQKYGYSPKGTSEENESSESRIVPQEIEPGRKKIVHMKMEYYTAPHDGNHVYDIEPKIRRSIDINTKPSREMNSKMSGTINNSEKDKDKKRKKSSAKSQQQHPNAGPDDLKFFQYFNYLGNGEHRAGGRTGNDKHYIEQHERGSKVAGSFQKKVKWADKDGGFGEHFWDLNHGR